MYGNDPAVFFTEAMSQYMSHPASKNRDKPAGPFTIAFSREAGSKGTIIAREVGRRLNWPVYDHELLEHLAKDLKVNVRELEEVDERPGSFLIECLRSFGSSASVSEVTYFHRLLRMLEALGERGECVIVGRGAPFALPAETTVRVRLVAPLQDRIAFMEREKGLDRAHAAEHVAARDRERTEFVKAHFRKDPSDPLNYDLVLNTSRYTVDEAGELVIEALQRLQARKPAKAKMPAGF